MLSILYTFWSCFRILKLLKNPMQFQTLLPISFLSTSVTIKKLWKDDQIKNETTFIPFQSQKKNGLRLIFAVTLTIFKNVPWFRGGQIGNRKQCLKSQWIFKQLKNSKTTSEGVNYVFEPTCAHARWVHRHRFPSVCDWTKNQTRKKLISQKVL